MSAEEQATYLNAVEVLAEECMADKGFEYDGGRRDASEIPAREQIELFYGWLAPPVEEARASGYGITDSQGAPPTTPRIARPPEDPSRFSPEKSEALFGSGADTRTYESTSGITTTYNVDSCYVWAYGQIGGTYEGFLEILDLRESFRGDFWQELPEDPDVRGAMRDWSECMADAGYPDIDEPGDALDAAAAAVNQGGGFEAEQAIAVAHAECLVSSGLDDAVATRTIPILEELSDGRADDLVRLAEGVDLWMENARAVVGP